MRNILLLFFVGFSPVILAQKLMVGPMVGGSISAPLYDDSEFKNRHTIHFMPGFQTGITTIWQASSKFALSHDLYYGQEGKKITGENEQTNFREYHHYVGVPIALRVVFGNDRFKYYGGLGPNIKYWLKSNGRANLPELYEIYETFDPLDYTLRFSDGAASSREVFLVSQPNRFQLGLDISGGLMVPIKHQWLSVDLRYTWGHTNMAKPESTYTPFAFYEGNLVHTQHSLQLSCAYLFSFDLFEMTHKGKSTKKVK
ncbi:MAG: hypothetical protein ACFB15_06905 [Cyclobacteriaceae bacterium]